MIVEAERADGALMVTDGPAAAVVLPNGMVTYLPKDSVYARGGWSPTTRGGIPASVDPERLAEVRARAEATVVDPDEMYLGEAAHPVVAAADHQHATFCRNPLHPGPCAKPGSKAYKRRGGGAGPAVEEPKAEAPKETPKAATPKAAPKAATPTTSGPTPIKKGPGGYKKLKPADADKMQAQMLDGAPWSEGHRTALAAYTGGDGYKAMNGGLRGHSQIDAATQRDVDNVRAAMRELPQNITVFRDTQPDTFGISGRGITAEQAKSLVGRTFHDKGFVSTSVNERSLRPVRMKISAPKGSRAAYVESVSRNQLENEVLFDRGTHFRIDRVEQDDRGDTVLHMTVVGQDA